MTCADSSWNTKSLLLQGYKRQRRRWHKQEPNLQILTTESLGVCFYLPSSKASWAVVTAGFFPKITLIWSSLFLADTLHFASLASRLRNKLSHFPLGLHLPPLQPAPTSHFNTSPLLSHCSPPPTPECTFSLSAFAWGNTQLLTITSYSLSLDAPLLLCHTGSEAPSPVFFYLSAWDSDAAPHLIFHVLLRWSDSGTTRLAEHLPAELHHSQSEPALPEQADLWCFRVCAHASVSAMCASVTNKCSALHCPWCAWLIFFFQSHYCIKSTLHKKSNLIKSVL